MTVLSSLMKERGVLPVRVDTGLEVQEEMILRKMGSLRNSMRGTQQSMAVGTQGQLLRRLLVRTAVFLTKERQDHCQNPRER